MRDPEPGEPTDGPRLEVTTTVRRAIPVVAASEKPCCAVENGSIVGLVDRDTVLEAIAGEGGDD